jgi:DNA-directed RNA polymerase specialized sigma24 family protein
LFHRLDTALSPADSENAKNRLELTEERLNKLLAQLAADPDEASAKYEVIRRRQQRFFEWNGFSNSEELVDETVATVARKLVEGVEISNLNAYFAGVARNVARVEDRIRKRAVSLDDIPEPVAPEPEPDPVRERRMQCLEECLDKLSVANRTLILSYYDAENKIDARKKLADSLGIPMNALRIRAYRLRAALEACVKECLDRESKPK